jgi:hypothetical protein
MLKPSCCGGIQQTGHAVRALTAVRALLLLLPVTGAVWECPLLAELNPLPAGGVPLGSSMHDRLALGSRRSYTQLAGSSNALSSIVGSPPTAEQQHWRPHEKQQLDKQDGHHPQQQQQQQPGLPPLCGGNGGTSSNDSSSSTAACDGLQSAGSGGLGGSSSARQRQALLAQGGAPYGVCAAGAPYPAFVSAAVLLSNWDEQYTHFYSISPDACTNPTIYWLGRCAALRWLWLCAGCGWPKQGQAASRPAALSLVGLLQTPHMPSPPLKLLRTATPTRSRYADGRFDLVNAKGPFRLDFGDVL